VAAPLYVGLAADRLPDTHIIALVAGEPMTDVHCTECSAG
jgi:hypothetical protein